MKFRCDRHGAAESPHQRADMGEANALARPVLGSGAAEQIEDALMILGIDAAAIVRNVENRKAELGSAADQDVARYAGEPAAIIVTRDGGADQVRVVSLRCQEGDPGLRAGPLPL